jgi:hypothetical protein
MHRPESMVFASLSTQGCRTLTGQRAQRERIPDFAPLHPACRCSGSLLWTTNNVHNWSLVRVMQNTQFCGDESKEEKNREVRNMASIAYLAHFRPHGLLLRLSVRSMIRARTTELRLSPVRALRSAVSNPLIHSLFKTTRLAFWASRVDSSRGAEI